jgi:hypothetical protein
VKEGVLEAEKEILEEQERVKAQAGRAANPFTVQLVSAYIMERMN